MLSSWGAGEDTVIALGVLYLQGKKPHLCRRQSIFRDSLRTHKIVPRTLTILNLFEVQHIMWKSSPQICILQKPAANKAKHPITFAIVLQNRMREATICDW